MSDIAWHEDATKTVRTLQIIVGAMTTGAFVFLAIVLAIGPQVKKPPGPLPPTPFTMIAAAIVVVGLIARVVVLWNISAKGRREIVSGTYTSVEPRTRKRLPPPDPADPCRDEKYLLSFFQTKTITSSAMFEGWVFFATIAYMIEGNPLSLGLAIVLILCVALHFPIQSRAIEWVERQTETLEQEKAMR